MSMLLNSNSNVAMPFIIPAIVIGVLVILFFIRFIIKKWHVVEDAVYSNDIHSAVSKLFENFIIVDAETGHYNYIEGMPEVGEIPKIGNYERFATALLDRFPVERERQEAAVHLDFKELLKNMNGGADIVSYNFHAPIHNDEWFTYNFIVVSRIEGRVKEFIIARQDITKLHVKEEENKRILEQARDEAEKGNRAKSDFLSNMSHEIRTPITAILGMNEMIERESDNENVLEYVDNIRKAGVSLLGIISDILDFSKIEAGHMELSETGYSLSSLISDTVNLTLLRAEEKAISLFVKVDQKLPEHLFGDEIKIKQIITNLLSNAVKYTEKGSIELTYELTEEDSESIVIHVSVKDTGIGIKPEEMDKLFTPFDRLDKNRTRTIEGTGLGLAITSKMLSLMGSRLQVESTYGKGSRFFFTLKQGVTNWDRIGEFDPLKYSEETKGKFRLQTLFTAPEAHILVVDDTPMNLSVICGLLKRTDMKIDAVENGAGCVKWFGESDYDLVFLDYRMPEMDGIETLTRLLEKYPEKMRHTPVICLTASVISGDREMMLKAGFTDYLTKPVNVKEMERTLMKYLPEEKVQITKEEEIREVDILHALPHDIFSIAGLNPKKGAEFCGGADEYIDALRIFASSIERRANTIEEGLEKMDLTAYTIAVHSLKSTSLSVGAVQISEKAKALEEAGNNEDIEVIKRDTPELLQMLRDLKPHVEKLFQKSTKPGSTPGADTPVSEEVFVSALSSIREFAELYDYDNVCMIIEMLEESPIPDSKRDTFNKLKAAVEVCDWDRIQETLGE